MRRAVVVPAILAAMACWTMASSGPARARARAQPQPQAESQSQPPAQPPAQSPAQFQPQPQLQPADRAFHCPRPGTVIEYGKAEQLTFKGSSGFWCEAVDAKGAPWRRFAMMAPPDGYLLNQHLERLWPLKLGNELSFTTEPPSDVPQVSSESTGAIEIHPFYFHHDILVTALERITIAAGSFDTVVIEHRRVAVGGSIDSSVQTYWYAPAVGFIIKAAFKGSGKGEQREATRITLPK